MSAPPIKSAPPPQVRPQEVARPNPNETQRPNHSAVRRSETERTHSSSSRQATDERVNADAQVFAQLLMPQGNNNDGQSNASGSGFSLPVRLDNLSAQLVDELAQQLPIQSGGSFRVTLMMPNLGKVYVKANKTESHWAIDLGFARADVLDRLQPRQGACEQALKEALGHDVQLSLHQDLRA
ncbi:type III secretion system HrpP C-terminal domain-containing protein [Pseudomonas rossensis]|uniref:type III secretion system HrpP C-terminal domain-containing protein n=1 Tax=Pseudomonas rossensis TaxID=2305471 RepID=UPI00326185A6